MSKDIVKSTVGALSALLVVLALAAGCGTDDTDTATSTTAATTSVPASATPTVTDVWARPALEGGNTAIYLSIHGGKAADELRSVTGPADFAESIEIHESVVADDHDTDDAHDAPGDGHGSTMAPGGQMRTMRPVDAIAVPAGGDVALEPGGYHVMVTGLHAELSVGDRVPVTLHFADAGEVQATASVREM